MEKIKKVKEYREEKGKKVVDFWKNSGLLEELPGNEKLSLALLLEAIKIALQSISVSDRVTVVIFPIARYCFSRGYNIRNVYDFIHYVESRHAQGRNVIIRDAIKHYEEDRKVFLEDFSKIDYEAEFAVAVAKEVIGNKL